MRRQYTSPCTVLRHEYAHAIADTHRGLMRSRQLTRAFGKHHGWSHSFEYDPEHHVTPATATGKGFAQVFALDVKNKGKLPERINTKSIRQKWEFICKLSVAISKGLRRWSPPSI